MTALFHLGSKAIPSQFLVIFLHGFGANGENLLTLAPLLEKTIPSAVFVAPNGFTPLTEYGPHAYQWFDLDEMTAPYIQKKCSEVREQGIQMVRSLQKEYKIPPERTILIGFSQGAMLALSLALSAPDVCRAVIGCAGGLYVEPSLVKPSKNLKILLIHGDRDEIVPVSESKNALQILNKCEADVMLEIIPSLSHSIDDRVVEKMQKFLHDQTKEFS